MINENKNRINDPIILVSGFLGASNDWCNKLYWNSALDFDNVHVASIQCVGSAHDRACEMYAHIRGKKTNFGKEHSEFHGHDQFGKDYTGNGLVTNWNNENPIFVVSHSFGGNTARAFYYLVSIDYFGDGTDSSWIKGITTLTSPIKGSLLTYTLGATEDHSREKPVWKFSPGYLLGLSVHFYEIVASKLNLDEYLDFGLNQWNVANTGFIDWGKRFLFGGENGGGTRCVCTMDNAAHDMTIEKSLEWNNKVNKVRENDPHHFEFNFVARKKNITEFSFFENLKQRIYGKANIQEGKTITSYFTAFGLHLRDFAVSHAASLVKQSNYNIQIKGNTFNVEKYQNKLSDGLCSGYTQYENLDNHFTQQEFFQTKQDIQPGQYSIFLDEIHDHFSIVPFPDTKTIQHEFFENLFRLLRSLPNNKNEIKEGNPNESYC